jgi:hypothetical protein
MGKAPAGACRAVPGPTESAGPLALPLVEGGGS